MRERNTWSEDHEGKKLSPSSIDAVSTQLKVRSTYSLYHQYWALILYKYTKTHIYIKIKFIL